MSQAPAAREAYPCQLPRLGARSTVQLPPPQPANRPHPPRSSPQTLTPTAPPPRPAGTQDPNVCYLFIQDTTSAARACRLLGTSLGALRAGMAAVASALVAIHSDSRRTFGEESQALINTWRRLAPICRTTSQNAEQSGASQQRESTALSSATNARRWMPRPRPFPSAAHIRPRGSVAGAASAPRPPFHVTQGMRRQVELANSTRRATQRSASAAREHTKFWARNATTFNRRPAASLSTALWASVHRAKRPAPQQALPTTAALARRGATPFYHVCTVYVGTGMQQ
jgi:hypothetical protein